MDNNETPMAAILRVLFPEEAAKRDAGLCPFCAEPIGPFRDDLSRKEYRITGLCQSCQDVMFGYDDDDNPLDEDGERY